MISELDAERRCAREWLPAGSCVCDARPLDAREGLPRFPRGAGGAHLGPLDVDSGYRITANQRWWARRESLIPHPFTCCALGWCFGRFGDTRVSTYIPNSCRYDRQAFASLVQRYVQKRVCRFWVFHRPFLPGEGDDPFRTRHPLDLVTGPTAEAVDFSPSAVQLSQEYFLPAAAAVSVRTAPNAMIAHTPAMAASLTFMFSFQVEFDEPD